MLDILDRIQQVRVRLRNCDFMLSDQHSIETYAPFLPRMREIRAAALDELDQLIRQAHPISAEDYTAGLWSAAKAGQITNQDLVELQARYISTQAPVRLPETPYERHMLPRHYIGRIRAFWKRRHGSPVARSMLRYYIKQGRVRRCS